MENLPYMGDTVSTSCKVIRKVLPNVTVELWKSPRCIVRGNNFEWIAEADRWMTVVVHEGNVQWRYSDSHLKDAWERARL